MRKEGHRMKLGGTLSNWVASVITAAKGILSTSVGKPQRLTYMSAAHRKDSEERELAVVFHPVILSARHRAWRINNCLWYKYMG